MELFFRKYGSGPALIILHGLYGSSDNWVTVASALSDKFEVFIPDQRNHGRSPHSTEHTYELLQNDILEFMDMHNIKTASILGHSMGGKTAMFFSNKHPDRISHMIVTDISPRAYTDHRSASVHSLHHRTILDALKSIDISVLTSRKEAELILSSKLESDRTVQFLLKNLYRDTNNQFKWRLNLDVLQQSIPFLLIGMNDSLQITGFPVLFLSGALSHYIEKEDIQLIQHIYPGAEIATVKNAGHWLHAEQTEEFIRLVTEFLENN
ncbi:MAG: alpha/beta fold hydrolase [Bacteroidota bacterium]